MIERLKRWRPPLLVVVEVISVRDHSPSPPTFFFVGSNLYECVFFFVGGGGGGTMCSVPRGVDLMGDNGVFYNRASTYFITSI